MLRISDVIVVGAVAGSGGLSALIDLKSRRVPNTLTLGIAALGLALAATHLTNVSVAAALAGFALGIASGAAESPASRWRTTSLSATW